MIRKYSCMLIQQYKKHLIMIKLIINILNFSNLQSQTINFMINSDFSHLNNYRSDGRKSTQIRNTHVQLGLKPNVDGSCLLKQGLTQVLCIVHGPYSRPNANDNLLKIQYTVAPFSSLERRKSKYDRDFSVYAQNIRLSFEAMIVGDTYTKSQINIIVTVIQNQGSAKSTVMNCISLGLINAGICMKDLMIASTVGQLNNMIIVDPNQQQQYDIENELVVSYAEGLKKIDSVELKNGKINDNQLKKLYNIALNSCQTMYKRLRKVLIEYSQRKMLIF